jgi:hypothetical protein
MATPPDNELSYIDHLARAESRRRIRASAGYTYLDEVLAASGDSSLRRWDERYGRPIRVYPGRTVEHFDRSSLALFAARLRRGGRGRSSGSTNADSVNAEIVFQWIRSLARTTG